MDSILKGGLDRELLARTRNEIELIQNNNNAEESKPKVNNAWARELASLTSDPFFPLNKRFQSNIEKLVTHVRRGGKVDLKKSSSASTDGKHIVSLSDNCLKAVEESGSVTSGKKERIHDNNDAAKSLEEGGPLSNPLAGLDFGPSLSKEEDGKDDTAEIEKRMREAKSNLKKLEAQEVSDLKRRKRELEQVPETAREKFTLQSQSLVPLMSEASKSVKAASASSTHMLTSRERHNLLRRAPKRSRNQQQQNENASD